MKLILAVIFTLSATTAFADGRYQLVPVVGKFSTEVWIIDTKTGATRLCSSQARAEEAAQRWGTEGKATRVLVLS